MTGHRGDRRCGPLAAVALAMALLLPAPPAAAAAGSAEPAAATIDTAGWAGRPLAEALRRLTAAGLDLVFSTAVVGPELRVAAEPAAGPPRQVLDEILRPHRLAARPAASGGLVVVRADAAEDAAAEPSGASTAGPAATVEETIVVTPSRYHLLGDGSASGSFLGREQVRRIPHLSDDVYRAVALLPGATGGDISARFHVRGGDDDELLVLVDGMEIYEPFHLEDLQSLFSIVDSQAIGGLELLTGGYPAEYGDRMSGVLAIDSAEPAAGRRTAAGLSLVNARLAGEGSGDSGSWLASVRGGYLDLVLDLTTDPEDDLQFSPTYYDLLAKVERRTDAGTRLAGRLLASWDDTELYALEQAGVGADERSERADASYGNAYLWGTAERPLSPRLFARALVSLGWVDRNRRATSDDSDARASCTTCEDSFAEVRDERSFALLGAKADADRLAGDRHELRFGAEARYLSARYDYASYSRVLTPLITGGREPVETFRRFDSTPDGQRFALWASDRWRLADTLTAEIGLRWDRQSWTPGAAQISPRLALAWRPAGRTALRAAWGRYFQSQGLHELAIEDGEKSYYPAELAEHRLVAVEHRRPGGLGLRLEAYDKRFSRLRPRYENLFEPIDLIPEGAPDRVRIAPERAVARGVELLVEGPPGRRFGWWASYALARAEDTVGGHDQPRSWDQRHTVRLALDAHLGERWSLDAVWLYHSGWPTTPVSAAMLSDGTVQPLLGERNSARFTAYHRLDLRLLRSIEIGAGGRLDLFFEVTNLYDRANVRAVSDFDFVPRPDGGIRVIPDEASWLPRIPSFGVTWSR